MKRWDIINHLIHTYGFEDYLEIGVRDGGCFEKVACRNKTGVDPSPKNRARYYVKHKATSDEFFDTCEDMFDIIFIDGLHLSEQVEKDINNAFAFLKHGGVIMCHDMNPIKKEHQKREYTGGTWNGDGWKAWVKCRINNPQWVMYVVDTDHGCGIIHPTDSLVSGGQELDLHYPLLENSRKEILNLISVDKFLEEIK